jgi:hypothetical protein
MRLSSMLMGGMLAVSMVGGTAYATATPAGAQEKPLFGVDITYDVSPPEEDRLCPIKVAFTAVVLVKNWHAGMAETAVTYHWERGTKKWPDHTLTVRDQAQSHFLRLHSEHGLRGHVTFAITKPYPFVANSNDLDILCR